MFISQDAHKIYSPFLSRSSHLAVAKLPPFYRVPKSSVNRAPGEKRHGLKISLRFRKRFLQNSLYETNNYPFLSYKNKMKATAISFLLRMLQISRMTKKLKYGKLLREADRAKLNEKQHFRPCYEKIETDASLMC